MQRAGNIFSAAPVCSRPGEIERSLGYGAELVTQLRNGKEHEEKWQVVWLRSKQKNKLERYIIHCPHQCLPSLHHEPYKIWTDSEQAKAYWSFASKPISRFGRYYR